MTQRFGVARFSSRSIKRCLAVPAVISVAVSSCAEPRPPNIPPEAVFVPAYRYGLWVDCWMDPVESVHCRFYNGQGGAIPSVGFLDDVDDDVYVPYRDTGRLTPEQLRRLDRRTGATIVWLTDGTILIPRYNSDLYRTEVDSVLAGR